MGRTVRRQIVRGRNLVGTNCKGRIIGGRSVRGQTVGVPYGELNKQQIASIRVKIRGKKKKQKQYH